jgi:hypothetical protein
MVSYLKRSGQCKGKCRTVGTWYQTAYLSPRKEGDLPRNTTSAEEDPDARRMLSVCDDYFRRCRLRATPPGPGRPDPLLNRERRRE